MIASLVRAAVVVCVLSTGAAMAATVTCGGACPSDWQAFPTSLTDNGVVYWDNHSLDTDADPLQRQKGIGHFLTEGSATGYDSALMVAPDDLNWFGRISGSAPADFYFNRPTNVSVNLKVLLHDTAAPQAFGYYDVQTGQRTLLFDTSTPIGSQVDVPLPAQFGFFMMYLEGAPQSWYDTASIYKTQSTMSETPEPDFHQHFVAFRQADGPPGSYTYYIGTEDVYLDPATGQWAEGVGDYNDFIVQMEMPLPPTDTPEPGTMGLAAVAVAAIVAGAFRRRART